MRPRYLLLVRDPGAPGGDFRPLIDATGLALAFEGRAMAALVNPACGCFPLGGDGVVLGTLFHRHGTARALDQLDPAAGAAILASDGAALLGSYWGGYVAALDDGAAVSVLRDPSGALPCYRADAAGATAFASDVDLLLEAGFAAPRIDWQALARFLHSGGLPAAETVLRGIAELLPGFAVQLPEATNDVSPCWSPWDFAQVPATDPGEAAERLERIVRHCLASWASMHARPLVSLSGGLDSSIVAACLAACDGEPLGLTLYTDDPAGDERGYARLLGVALGLPLVERRFRIEDIDITAPLGAHLPRPIGRVQDQAYERAHLEVARAQGAGAFFTGNGGDNVFGYSQSAAPIVDRALHEGLTADVLRTFGDVCRQTGCGPLAALSAALRIAVRPHAYRWRPVPAFLHPELCRAMTGEELCHPWLEAPAGALPGKAAHIAALLRVQTILEPGRSRHAPLVNPLLSQPVVEACLAIPSWTWRAGGRDRALAREAFASRLPEPIVQRRTKGGPDSFCCEIARHFRDAIRTRLLDGRLAYEGLADRRAIDRALQGDRLPSGEETVRLLELVNVEARLDAWISRLAALKAPAGRQARAASDPSA